MSSSQESSLEKILLIVTQILEGQSSGNAGDATAANQVIGNASISSIDANLGATNDSFATSDTGTATLISLFKRLLSKKSMVVSRPTITVSTSPAYSIGDVAGGIISIPSVNITGDTVAKLQSITFKDRGGLSPELHVYFFRSTPTGGTYTDNAALVWASGDSALKTGVIKVLASDWLVDSSQSVAQFSDLEMPMGSASTGYFMLIVAGTTYAPANTDNLSVELGFER